MGFIGSLLSNSQGAGFQGSGTNIANPTDPSQTAALYNQAQGGLGQQQAFLNALQAQGGIQNQSNVYNQLQGVANGTGPNPAQAMLAQQTGANVAAQGAMAAGQRGASSNVGLIARQAGQQGAATQQQAVGQGATLQAQQSLNALGQMGGIAGQQVAQQQGALAGYNQGTQSEQQNLLNAVAQNNTANVGMQSNINNVNAAIAQGNQAEQAGLFNGAMQGVGGALSGSSSPLGSMMADGGQVEPITQDPDRAKAISNGFNSSTMYGSNAPQPQPTPQPVQNYDDGGEVSPIPMRAVQGAVAGVGQGAPQSSVGQFLSGYQPPSNQNAAQAPAAQSAPGSGAAAIEQGAQQAVGSFFPKSSSGGSGGGSGGGGGGGGMSALTSLLPLLAAAAHGGKVSEKKGVPVMLSPGEQYLSPHKASLVAKGKADPMSGKKVLGKAKVPGDSLENDNVPATLEKGGVVVKRSVMATHDPKKVAAFVQAVMAKSGVSRAK
jgi:hypothetical protein